MSEKVKIGIIGCGTIGSVHADAYAKVEDAEVVALCDILPDKLKEKFGVKVLSSYDEAVGKVDGVIITARRGGDHYRFAKPYIASGVPMFIDKPVTISEAEAIEMVKDFEKNGVRMTGGSSCVHVDFVRELKRDCETDFEGKTLGGFVRCPVSLNNAYGGFYFYCEHLIGITSTIFGFYPESVKAFENDGKITVVFRYKDYDVTGLFVDGNYIYYAMRCSVDGVQGSEFPITGESPCFRAEFDEFYDLLNGGKQKKSYSDFIAPVFVMNAVKRSMEGGKEEKVNKFEL